jgi:very-short-patch-repair endonuclease
LLRSARLIIELDVGSTLNAASSPRRTAIWNIGYLVLLLNNDVLSNIEGFENDVTCES